MNYRGDIDIQNVKVAVFCHIYYEDLVEECMRYLQNIPEYVDIYISFTEVDVQSKVEKCISDYNIHRCILKRKLNRGRDISSLLVTFRKQILEYDYFCFIHDKKSIDSIKSRETVDYWRNLYFDCLLYSKEYIEQILCSFAQNQNLGVLTAPQPSRGEYIYTFGDEWLVSYEVSKRLHDKLKLNKILDRRNNRITLGTAFWARTKALEKLLKYPFKYEDFPEEPMKPDGQLGHAVERLIGFIAEDSGYYWDITMPNFIAQARAREFEILAKRLLYQMRKFSVLKEEECIDSWFEYIMRLHEYIQSKKAIYIYGAGFWGEKSLDILNNMNVAVQGIIVSDGYKCNEEFHGIKVYELSELKLNSDIGIIIGVYDVNKNREQVIENLRNKEYDDYFVMH